PPPPPPPPAATSTLIVSDTPDPSQVGQAVGVRFTVTSQGGTPTGTVTVTATGGTESCTGTVANGGCTLVLNAAGQRTLTATYGGSSGFSGSSDTEPHQVQAAPPPEPAATTTQIVSDAPDPSDVGQAVTVEFSVTSAGGTPSGTVTVSAGPGESCSGTVAAGECSITLNTSGERTLTASYAGNAGFAASSDTEGHTVNAVPPGPAATTTEILSDEPDPSETGQAVTIRFQVTSDGATPTGSVIVSDGEGQSCSATVAAGECAIAFDSPGQRTLTANYAGNDAFAPSADTEDHVVTEAPPPGPSATTTEILSDNPDPSETDQAVTVRFRVTSESGAPAGNVTVSASTTESCSATVAEGQCSITLTTAGSRTLTARYAGTDQFEESADTEPHTVQEPPPPPPAETTTEILSDIPDPSEPGEDVIIRFSVTSDDGAPTGTVTVSAGPGETCSGTVAQGQCTITFDTPGARDLTATYPGNETFAPSSDEEAHTVEAAPPAGTTTTITSDDPDPSDTDEEVTIVFSVTSDGATPTGTVTVSADPGETCSATVAAGQCTITFDSPGLRTLTADYPGNDRFAPSSGTDDHRVSNPPPAATITEIESHTPETSAPGDPVTIGFSVTSAAGVPTGGVLVTASDGDETCSAAVGVGECVITLNEVGVRTLTATYSGNDLFGESSGTQDHTVEAPNEASAVAGDAYNSTAASGQTISTSPPPRR
nr:Ig-like domain repeat protein [Gemmatimonadales bacterium]